MRVGRESLSAGFRAKVFQLLFGNAPLQKRAGVDAGGGVSLEVDEVGAASDFVAADFGAGEGGVCGAEEVVEADIVEDGGGGEGGDVSAEFAGLSVCAHDHGEGVPPHEGADSRLALVVAGGGLLQADGDGVDVRRCGAVRGRGPGFARVVEQGLQQEMRPRRPGGGDNGCERVPPLPGLAGVCVADMVVGHDNDSYVCGLLSGRVIMPQTPKKKKEARREGRAS